MIQNTWEPYGNEGHIQYNYITGVMKCASCGEMEVPADEENLNSKLNWLRRMRFNEEHLQCKLNDGTSLRVSKLKNSEVA